MLQENQEVVLDGEQSRLEQFTELYFTEYGITLTREKAQEEAFKLLQLYKLVLI